jgi:uncharacterized protein with GYD domain
MPHYLVQASYTAEALAALAKNPQNRIDTVAEACAKSGGRLEAGYFAFGDHDVVCIVELPDNAAAAGLAIGSASKGHIRSIKTTPLLSAQEAMDAMQAAGGIGLQPPG